ncbi:Rossmann-fold NAD(P)-binding domain-containing protein [Corynebacterium camporealensis]
MQAPRMRVALFGASLAGRRLADGLEAAGHSVSLLQDPANIAEADLLILGVEEDALQRAIDVVEEHMRDGLIVMHTCLSRGVQDLDPLETRGCVVAALAPIQQGRWALTALDELGETIAGLLTAEMHAVTIALKEDERGLYAARLYYAQVLARLSGKAHLELDLVDDPDMPAIDEAAVRAAYRYITEPGLRRAYVESVRRLGEVEDRHALEMWAFQEENS